MDAIRFIDELNAAAETPPSAIWGAILRERTAPVERRLAALLWHTSFSADDLLANAAFELIIELPSPEPIADPFETDRGRDIRGLLHASPEELRVISCDESVRNFRRLAAELILQAASDDRSFNPDKDRILLIPV